MAKKQGPISLTQTVLAGTDQGEMRAFFNWYLRNDVKAQLQFLTRFSDRIPMEESEKFEWLFYKSIQLLRGSAAYLGVSKQKILLRIFEELNRQAADALAVNHFVKTFYICSNGLTFTRLLKAKERTINPGFEKLFNSFLQLLHRLYQADLPRDLIQRLIRFVDQEEPLSRKIKQNDSYSLMRLKISLEYYHNGIEALMSHITEKWGRTVIKSSEDFANFYHALLTEPWFDNEKQELKTLDISREVWKIIILRLRRSEDLKTLKKLWRLYKLKKLFSDSKYSRFVSTVESAIKPAKKEKPVI